MNILVCGGAGFIGSNFVHYLFKTYPDYSLNIVVYDKLTYAGNLDNLKEFFDKDNFTFIQGCITDYEKLESIVKEHKIEYIINFAAETHVDRSIHGACKDFVITNTLGVQIILEVIRNNKVLRFINVSTDEVYGDLDLNDNRKFDEKWPIFPNMPYAAAKAGGDMMCNAYYRCYKVPVIVTHCSNNYGPYQFPEKIIPFFTFKLMNNEKVPVYGDGLNVRDWIHVEDHVRALDLLLHKGKVGEIYNIGADNERSNIELTKMILKILGKGEDMIEYVTDRPGHDRKYAIDASKIRKLGWRPIWTADKFEQGLRQTIEWYQKNTEWVEKLKEKRNEMNKFQEVFCKVDNEKISKP